jgi:polyisoprenyl-phosphate glycosyltransferase
MIQERGAMQSLQVNEASPVLRPEGEASILRPAAEPPVISVVIPVYNEGEEVLDSCLREVSRVLNEFGKPWEIIFIDDFSADNSLKKLMTFLDIEPRVTVVAHPRNLGAVKAILSGLKQSRGQVVIPFDPDLQFAPEAITEMATQVLNGYDFCGGIREGPTTPSSSGSRLR